MGFLNLGSISRKLALLVFIAILPALAILLYSGMEQRKDSIDNAKQNVLLLTNSMAQVQVDSTRSSLQMLSTLALLPEVQNLDLTGSKKVFAAILEKNPDFQNITLTALNGEVLVSGLPSKATNLGDRKHVREALENKDFAVGEYIVTRVGKQNPAFAYAYPVLDNLGNPQAVLTTAINLERFESFYHASTLPDKSFVAVTDHQGIRLFYYPPREDTNPIGKPIKAESWALAENAADAGIFIRTGSDGARRIFAFNPVRIRLGERPYLYVWAGVPEAQILESANETLTRNLLLMLMVTLLALFIAWALGHKTLILPIRNLVAMTQRFAAGELDVRSELSEKCDEFGKLTNAFHDMAAGLTLSHKALLENEARFRLIMDGLDALVYVADMETYEILFINQFGRKIFGDVTGQICWQTIQDNQGGPCSFCTNKYLLAADGQPGEIYTWEFQNTVTGQWFYIHDRAIEWIDKRIVRLEIASDITERKLAETRLAQETERLSVTLRSIGDGVITTDTEGRIVLINQIAENLTGWESVEAVGCPLSEVFNIVNTETGQPSENPVAKVLASGAIVGQTEHIALIAKNGQQRRITDSGAPIRDGAGEVIGVVLVFRDISDQLRTEQELLKVKKLESIGVLAGGIAHDFNNILAAILGNIDLSLRDKNLSERTERLLKQALNASSRARDLTQQLLTFAKGGQPIKEAASLAEVVRDSADFVLRGDKVACRYQFADDLWLVDIDKGQISQVVQNIILNASNAMPDGGIIEVAGENVDSIGLQNIALSNAGHFVRLSIRDSGIGIPANILDKIFDPYFSTKQQGSGLGLAITHSIINKHGGTISVKSTPGHGSTFTIYLPASPQGSLPETTAQETSLERRKARILVVDDEELVRDVAEEMLTEMGHEVLLAKDGMEAVQAYQASIDRAAPIDLLIMDLTIPGGMGGTVAMQKILAIDADAKAIVSSGYSNDPVLAHYKDYGFSAAIIKPYELLELRREVNQLIG